MRDHRHFLFYTDHVETSRLFLDAEETRHAVAVLRLKTGGAFAAADGCGTMYECRVESIVKHRLEGSIVSRSLVPRHPCSIRVFAGLPERPAFERLITDLTALGVQRITPLVCRHCQQQWWVRSKEAMFSERFRSKMIAAMKQSLYPYLPRLDPPASFASAMGSGIPDFCIVADDAGVPFSGALDTLQRHCPSLAVVVGPPGGFAADEQNILRRIGGLHVNIAATRLTTELAVVALCSQILGACLTPAHFPPLPGPAA